MFTVALQCRRVRGAEPEDDQFVLRYWVDLQFLIVALRKLRRTAELAATVRGVADTIHPAIETFDAAVPGLAKMRNIGEHIDEYAVDSPKRRYPIDRRSLQVGSWDGTTFTWLGTSLNVDEALSAAKALYGSVRAARPRHEVASGSAGVQPVSRRAEKHGCA